jgi:hypothetical protein
VPFDTKPFNCEVASYPIPGDKVPVLSVIQSFVEGVQEWLDSYPGNVAVVCCPNGVVWRVLGFFLKEPATVLR